MQMATERIPCGGFFVDTSTLQFQGKVLKAVGGQAGAYLPLSGGTMEANAVIEGAEELRMTVGDDTTAGIVGVTNQGVTLARTKDGASASIKVIDNAVKIDGGNSSITINGIGINMGGTAITGLNSLSGNSGEIAIENQVDMNNHKITTMTDPTDPQDAATKKYVDEHSVLGADGKIDSDLDMNEHGIINAHKISTDGPAPLFLGSTIEATGTTAPRLTGVNDGTAAFVKADTQAEYVSVSVGTPTAESHATPKFYVDGKTQAIQASAILKSGGKMIGKLKLGVEPSEDDDAVTKKYADAILPAFTEADNGKVLGIVNGVLAWVDKA